MKSITVETIVHKDMETVWESWTNPTHIQAWMHASDDWECPHATNDLTVGGTFLSTLAAKDKSFSFDIVGTYTVVEPGKRIAYTMEDGRTVDITFTDTGAGVHLVETFDMEDSNPEEIQRAGWQAILDNFAAYTEAL